MDTTKLPMQNEEGVQKALKFDAVWKLTCLLSMKEYKCTSRIVMGQPCEHSCQVKCEFEPRACLKYAIAEEWQEVVNENLIKESRNPSVK